MTVLQEVDGNGKRSLLAFLYGAGLIEADDPAVKIFGAYLRGVNLQGADLHGANLHGAYLEGAKITAAQLALAKYT